ncbi:hypothetical protein GCM10009844_43510 [Nocardioides koreensis]|uniref:N-acetyltransferase domain-containing protein n=1 Tax=Nocardioides koreensis TaxID=433651 RepID=A0ABN3A7V7_9ACTN
MITCREVTGSDALALAGVLEDAEEDQRRLQSALDDPHNTVYRLDDGDVVAGAAVVVWNVNLHELLYVAVARDRRGQGLGRVLVERIIADLDRRGGVLEVGTANSSLDNIAVYQRLGFRMSVVLRNYFDYVGEGVIEFGIPLRDMIVFDRAAQRAAGSPGAPASARMVLIPGSTRPDSTNVAALRTVRDLFDGAVLFEGLADIPPLVPGGDSSGHVVEDLRNKIADADLVVLSTPEYAGSLPGTFKNFLDWTVGGGDLYGKPVVWLDVAAEGRGRGASAELSKVLGYVDARVLRPGGIKIPVPRGAVGPGGTVNDPDFRAAAVRELGNVLAEVLDVSH